MRYKSGTLRRLALGAVIVLVTSVVPLAAGTAPASAASAFTSTVVNQGSTDCLDDPGSSTATGTQLIQWSCNGGANQNWSFTPVSGTSSAYTVADSAGLCADVSGRSSADNAKIIQWTCNSQTNQQFTLTPSGGTGVFELVSVNSGKCVVPAGDSTANDTGLVQLPCTGAATRIWQLPGYSGGGSSGGGTWTPAPVNPYSNGPATFMWLLSDGSILSNGADLHQWVKLVPDQYGSYANGTWVPLATSPYGLGAAQEHILPDGRFYQAGGEYVYFWPAGSSSNDHNGVQLYDPVTDTWSLGQSGLYGNLQDTGSASLRDGSIVSSDQQSPNTQIFNPKTNTWRAAGSRPAPSGEDGWVPLSDGSVVALGASGQYRYDPSASTWITLPSAPSSYANGNVDSSMSTLLYDGRIFVMGSNATALYTPGSTPSSPGSWAQGPATPQGTYTDDVYTTPEPNGKVMFDSVRCSWITNQCGSSSGALIDEFDPATNTITAISQPGDPGGTPVNFINLPNGQVMAAAGTRNYIYTPTGSPQNSWRPTVGAVTANGNGSYHLTGTQLSGLVSTGEDDFQAPENYPIVSLRDSAGHVYYARSFNFSSMVPSKPGEAQSTDFTLPSGLAHGTYSLYVSSCGVSSASGYSFTY